MWRRAAAGGRDRLVHHATSLQPATRALLRHCAEKLNTHMRCTFDYNEKFVSLCAFCKLFPTR